MLDWLTTRLKRRNAAKASPSAIVSVSDEGSSDTLKDMGDRCLDAGDWRGAERFYRLSIDKNCNNASAHNNLGLALMELGRFEDAVQSVRRATALDANLFNAHYILGAIEFRLGKPKEAIAHFVDATKINPEFSEAFAFIGNILSDTGASDAARQTYQKAIEINPGIAEYYVNIAGIAMEGTDRQAAIEWSRRALAIDPTINTARLYMVHQMQQLCEWTNIDREIDLVRRHIREAPFNPDARDSPFSFLVLPGTTALEQKICAEKWAKACYAKEVGIRDRLNFKFERHASTKIKIGYLSADFQTHATSVLMAEIFELHDRSRFHIVAYSYGADDGGSMRARLRHAFDEFVDIRSESIVESAQRIYRDGIDILVDLKGYTGNSRSNILALRPAPIQVNFLGYPGTMGAEFVDYLIADRFVIPPESQGNYSERVAYLPNCYQPNDRTRARPEAPTRASQNLPDDGLIFCCLNQTYKISPEMFEIWCDLLSHVPDSYLWLLSNTKETECNLRQEAKRRGIDDEKLIFASRASLEVHLSRLQCADIFLDTYPVNAHTTCSDALWMGLPIVTYAGESFVSRVAGSLLTALGIPEMITYSLQNYAELARELAVNVKMRTDVRDKIVANRDQYPLFDSARFTRDLEGVFEKMALHK